MFRICPICNHSERTHLFTQQFAEIEGVTFLKGYDVVQCEHCGFIFADQIPEQAQFDEYYERSSKYEGNYSGHVPTEAMIDHFRQSLGFLESSLQGCGIDSKELNIVDIGCATGNFLRFLKENGYTKLSGIDPSAECVQILKRNGIHAVQSSLFQTGHGETYDMVMLLSVLEHIRDLSHAIELVKTLLTPNGIFYLAVPDAAHFYAEKGIAFQQFSSEHINYFTLGSLRNLLDRFSFELLGYRVYKDLNTGFNTAFDAIFQLRSPDSIQTALSYDGSATESISQYISHCKECEAELNQKLEELVFSQEPILVWGCGTHTLRQLAVGNLGKCNIKLLIDSNPHFSGRNYHGIPIIPPKELSQNESERILVSAFSPLTERAIMQYAKESLHLDNEFIQL